MIILYIFALIIIFFCDYIIHSYGNMEIQLWVLNYPVERKI